MATGDPREGAHFGHGAIDAASGIRSLRAADDLRELARYAYRYAAMADVANLRQRITTVVLHA